MKKIAFLLLLVLLTVHSWGQSWTRVKLNKLSLDFPSSPDLQKVGNKRIYQVNESDYIINVIEADMSSNPNFNIESDELNDFYRGVIQGRLHAATDAKLLTQKEVELGGYKGLEVKYSKDFNGM